MERLNTRNASNRISNPPDGRIKSFLKHYENKRYGEAQKVATWLTKKFPKHPFGWKALSALFQRIGKFSDALHANQKVVRLLPQDADAHYASGNILSKLGRLEQAQASYKRAVALKPDFAVAHHTPVYSDLQQFTKHCVTDCCLKNIKKTWLYLAATS